MSYQPPAYPSPPTNGLGIAGFVVSLVGFITCGLLCPIGLILSAVAMRREPRGLAIAGLVIGLIGSVGTLLIFLIWGISIFSMCSCLSFGTTSLNKQTATLAAIGTAETRIEAYRAAHGGALPNDPDGTAEIAGTQDGWGRPLRYHKIDPTHYQLRSAGADGTFDTFDDRAPTIEVTPILPPGPELPVPAPER